MIAPELGVECPKCGAPAGYLCVSIRDPEALMWSFPYNFHKKRHNATMWIGAPSTKPLTVPARSRVMSTRRRVGAVDSAVRDL